MKARGPSRASSVLRMTRCASFSILKAASKGNPEHFSTVSLIARTIAENGPLAVRAIKETVEKCSGLPFDAAFKIENEAQRVIRKTEDAREGPRAFMEKRKPNYKGR